MSPRTVVEQPDHIFPDKPLLDLPAVDRPFMTGQSVEGYLNSIRRTLALMAVVNAGGGTDPKRSDGEHELDANVVYECQSALQELAERAFQSVEELKQALSGEIQNLHVRSDFTRKLSPEDARDLLEQLRAIGTAGER